MSKDIEDNTKEYIMKIYKDNVKDFVEFYESVDFSKIKDDKVKRDVFYFILFQYSVKSYDEEDNFYNDFETIIDALEEEDYLKNTPEFYSTILNNYFDKLDKLLLAKNEDEKSHNLIKKILKKISEIYIPCSKIKNLLITRIKKFEQILKVQIKDQKRTEKNIEIINKTMEKIEINFKKQILNDGNKIIKDCIGVNKMSKDELLDENKKKEKSINNNENNIIYNENKINVNFKKNDQQEIKKYNNINENEISQIDKNVDNKNKKGEIFDFVDNIAEKYFFNICQEIGKNNNNYNAQNNISNNISEDRILNNNTLTLDINAGSFNSFFPKSFTNNMGQTMGNNFSHKMLQQGYGFMPNQMSQFKGPQMGQINQTNRMKYNRGKK